MLTGARRGLLLIMMGLASAALTGCATTNAVPRPFPSPDWKAPAADPNAPAPIAPLPPSGPLVTSVPPDADGAAPPAGLLTHPYDGRSIAEFALGFRGVPYRLGGADPAGFDCSGLVQYVFAQYGVVVPRVVEQQYEVGDKVKEKNIKPGDLLFFSTKGSGATHVAIAIGEDRFVHAPNSRGVVRVEALTSDYWGSHFIGARRLPDPNTSN
jgi:NlpC/P60 family